MHFKYVQFLVISQNAGYNDCKCKRIVCMSVEIITKEDLQLFRLQLLQDLKSLLEAKAQPVEKRWLRSSEVRKLLRISPGTLQNLRIGGRLHPSKVGGMLYYREEEIHGLLNGNGHPIQKPR